MAIVSIKSKLHLDEVTKKELYSAYELFNNQVKIFEKFLLLAQQQDYYYRDENDKEVYVSEEVVKQELKEYIKNNTAASDVDAVMVVLLGLKELIKSRGSQAAASLSKLYDIKSTAGTNNEKKIIYPKPEWMNHYDAKKDEFESDDYKNMADIWIKSSEGMEAIKPSIKAKGNKSSFKKAYLEHKRWYKALVKDQERYIKDSQDGLSFLINELERLNALPIIKIDSDLYTKHPTWVRAYLKAALENYASYIACDEQKRNDYESLVDDYKKQKNKIEKSYKNELEHIDLFLKSFYIDENVYLNERMIRGSSEIYKKWKSSKNTDERIEIINKYQSNKQMQRKIGDVNLFRLLAQEDNQSINDIILNELVNYHQLLKKINDSKCCASYTTADPIRSQRYLSFFGEGGSNSPKYKLDTTDGFKMKIPVVTYQNNTYLEKNLMFSIVPNNQFQGPYTGSNNRNKYPVIENKKNILFSNDKKILNKENGFVEYENFQGELGGAEIRPYLNGNGMVKDFFVSFTITVKNICDSTFESNSIAGRALFSSAYNGKVNKHVLKIKGDNIKAMAIDLGLKQFGACAIGSVNINKDNVLQDDIQFERRFMLKLPGEDVSYKIKKYREKEMLKIRTFNKEIKFILFLKQMFHTEVLEIRLKKLEKALDYYKDKEKSEALQCIYNQKSIERMNDCIKKTYDYYVHEMNAEMKFFRNGNVTKKQKRNYYPGKSYWNLEYLENLRKLIMSWNSVSFDINAKNNQMNREYGVTATRLLEHINHIKDDRIKTGADMIIQSARGYIYDENNNVWLEKYSPCNLIIFEDLSRYKFKNDRPKRENSKLMRWSHSAIMEEVERQAELYGIKVIKTDAAYSSKYHYETGTPGIRADNISKMDLDEYDDIKKIVRDNLPEEMKDNENKLTVGSIIPSEIGSIFITIDKDGKLIKLNADINAACNLLKRAFKQQIHINTISTINDKGLLKVKGISDDEETGKLLKGKYKYNFGTTKIGIERYNNNYKIVPLTKKIDYPEIGDDKVYSLCNDPSGVFYDSNEWVSYKNYWDKVKHEIYTKLNNC